MEWWEMGRREMERWALMRRRAVERAARQRARSEALVARRPLVGAVSLDEIAGAR